MTQGGEQQPRSFETEAVLGRKGMRLTADVSTIPQLRRPKLSVSLSPSTLVRAFDLAYDRLAESASVQDGGIALVELLTWLDVIAEQETTVAGTHPVAVLRHVRNQCHHKAAFAVTAESGDVLVWQRWSVIPVDRPGRKKAELEAEYRRSLEGKPVIPTLEPVRRVVDALSVGSS